MLWPGSLHVMKAARLGTGARTVRALLALGISLAVHVAVVGVAISISAWQVFSLAPPIRPQAIAIDLVKDLPLGAPPGKGAANTAEAPAEARKPRRHRVASAGGGVTVAAAPDAGVVELRRDAGPGTEREPHDGGGVDGGRRRPGDLRSNGPEGSRLVALLHIDRLRAAPDSERTIAALDQLLLLLPDRRRLIDETGLDLYRDFDSLLIATPNPADASVTFLAARHHVGDGALKSALDRAARAARQSLRWQTVDGRPLAIRQQRPGAQGLERDDRILVLPSPDLALMATPAYATQLLGVDPATGKPATAYVDAGAGGGGQAALNERRPVHWRDIVERIDAEDAAMPDDAVFMMTATNLFGPATGQPGAVVLPGSRGANEDVVTSVGRAVPEAVTLVVGAQTPHIELEAELKSEADARAWEQELPAWRRKLLGNPLVVISGFAPLLRRAEISRSDATVAVRVDASVEEIQRLLNLAANLTRAALGDRR